LISIKKINFLFLIVGLFAFSKTTTAQVDGLTNEISLSPIAFKAEAFSKKTKFKLWALQKATDAKLIKKEKAIAVALAITLGPFGEHRLYLGTEAKVPVIYTLTLGGGLGILPLCDIIAIIATKNLEDYKNSSKVIMWAE